MPPNLIFKQCLKPHLQQIVLSTSRQPLLATVLQSQNMCSASCSSHRTCALLHVEDDLAQNLGRNVCGNNKITVELAGCIFAPEGLIIEIAGGICGLAVFIFKRAEIFFIKGVKVSNPSNDPKRNASFQFYYYRSYILRKKSFFFKFINISHYMMNISIFCSITTLF